MGRRLLLWILAAAAVVSAQQPRRVLYLTHTAGFRHDCIPASAEILQRIARESGRLEVTWSEDASTINADNLRTFDAVLFYTSGELPFSDSQKQALLDFVQRGGGFAGAHSATDTLYGWAEYGNLIGGYFDGHPWAQRVRIDVEDPKHPATAHLASGFEVVEEIYQFRNLSRERVRVLMTLDLASADPQAPGAHQNTTDFPLAWTRLHGEGRVFYTALGHFEETWRDTRYQQMMVGALLWITKQDGAPGAPRSAERPVIISAGNSASMEPLGIVAPGSFVSIYGRSLTPGDASASSGPGYAAKLAGATVDIDGKSALVSYAGPGQLNVTVPSSITGPKAILRVTSAGQSAEMEVAVEPATPGIFAVTRQGSALILWATGLGNLQAGTRTLVRINGQPATVLYSGMTTQWPGLYQVNVDSPSTPSEIELQMEGSPHIARYRGALP